MQRHVEVTDLSLLSFLAAEEVEKLGRNASSDGRYLSSLVEHLDSEISSDTGVKNLAPSAWRMYRKAINEATKLEPKDMSQLDAGLREILKELHEARDEVSKDAQGRRLGPEDFQKLFRFLLSLHTQFVAQRQQASQKRAKLRYRV